ncbi:hypothetical protein OZX60_06775 [Streptococcaceae bacterium ESL0687]|nr:hypothetical protein OZX60_06775 [Streptococcaceae bacterium ESL0687]
MKIIRLLILGVLTVLVFHGVNQVRADEFIGAGQTQVTIKILDGDESEVDVSGSTLPYDTELAANHPKEKIAMNHVPDVYGFIDHSDSTTHQIDAEELAQDNKVEIFNDSSKRDWVLKASVYNNQVTRDHQEKNKQTDYHVTRFEINKESMKTGVDTIIAKCEHMTTEENTGIITNYIKNLEITFKDSLKSLKDGDAINGRICYHLYMVPKN